jgi:uncharacterized protein (UPF0548 family)
MAPQLGGFFLWRPSAEDLRALEIRLPRRADTAARRRPPRAALPAAAHRPLPLSRSLLLNFPFPGATRAGPPPRPELSPAAGWAPNRRRERVGAGGAAFAAAAGALRAWRHFDLGWAAATAPPPRAGAGVVVIARTLGLWSQNPLRVAYVEERRRGRWPLVNPLRRGGAPRGARLAFGAATLEGHQLAGEERFSLEWDGREAGEGEGGGAAGGAGDDERGGVFFEVYSLSRPATPLAWLAQPVTRLYQRRFAADAAAAVRRCVGEAAAGRRRD